MSPTHCPTPTPGSDLDKSLSPRVARTLHKKGYPRPNYPWGLHLIDPLLYPKTKEASERTILRKQEVQANKRINLVPGYLPISFVAILST